MASISAKSTMNLKTAFGIIQREMRIAIEYPTDLDLNQEFIYPIGIGWVEIMLNACYQCKIYATFRPNGTLLIGTTEPNA